MPNPANQESLLKTARAALKALAFPGSCQAEIYLEAGRLRRVAWGEGKPKETRCGETRGAAIRLVQDGRLGFATAQDFSLETLHLLRDKAVQSLAVSPPDPCRGLPGKSGPAKKDKFPLETKLFKSNVKAVSKRLAGYEGKTLKMDKRLKKVLEISYTETLERSAIANSSGVGAEKSASSVSISLEVLGESAGETQTGWAWQTRRLSSGMDIEGVLREAADRAVSGFGAGPLPSGVWPVLVDPRVGAELLDVIAQGLRADKLQKGCSPFIHQKGRGVAAATVSLTDAGGLKGGLSAAAVDDEGVRTQTIHLVKDGVLKSFFYDTAAARRDGTASTGNARREGLSSVPAPGPSHFYMEPGSIPVQALIAQTPKAFWVKEVLGMHTADEVSGDFSVGASGLLIEKGRVVRAVKGVTLAGNLIDLLKKIDAVGNDLTWHNSIGAPTFRVSGLAIGGN